MGVTTTGATFHQLAGCGSLSKKRARTALGDIVKAGAHVSMDQAAAYDGLFRELRAEHDVFDSKKDRAELSPINTLHSRTKRFMRRFNGIASKNLSRYLSWMFWLDGHAEDETLGVVVGDTYSVRRGEMTGEFLPPMDDLSRLTLTRKL